MIAILAFLESPLGRLAMYGVMALFIAGGTVGGYFYWKHTVKMEALAEYNAHQLAQAKADNDRFQKQLEELQKNGDAMSKKLDQQAAALQQKNKKIIDWLNSPEVKKKGDAPASDLLKETIRRLSQ